MYASHSFIADLIRVLFQELISFVIAFNMGSLCFMLTVKWSMWDVFKTFVFVQYSNIGVYIKGLLIYQNNYWVCKNNFFWGSVEAFSDFRSYKLSSKDSNPNLALEVWATESHSPSTHEELAGRPATHSHWLVIWGGRKKERKEWWRLYWCINQQ